MVHELQLHRTSTQYTNPLAQHVPDNHEGNVPAITVRLACRRGDRTATEQPQHRPPDEPHVKRRTMSREVPLDPHRSKLPVKRKYSTCGGGRCMSTPPKRKHGHERDATQLASSGSIPTSADVPRYRSRQVFCGGAPQKGRTDLLSNTALGSSTSSTLCCACQEDVFRVEDPFLISIADVSRAHFHADAVRGVCVRWPNEDSKAKELGVCGKLRKTMYGFWDAAQR